MRVLSAVLVLVVLVSAGCVKGPADEADAAAGQGSALQARIAALEKTNQELQSELDRVQQGYESLQLQVASLANSAGDVGNMEDLVAEAFEKHLASGEEREEERREKQRKEWEKRRKEAGDRRLNEFAEELDLNDEQEGEVKVAWQKMAKDARETWSKMRHEGGMDREKMTKAIETLASQHSDAMKKILNEEQFAKYDTMEDGIMQRLQMFGGGDHGRGRDRGRGRGGDRRREDAAKDKKEAPKGD